MGEFAEYDGQRIKIGTCEDMYYLRADQAHKVTAVSGSVDPVKDRDGIRFRFPWPDEDDIEPGEFDRFDRSARLDGMSPPVELIDQHYSVQFVANGPGYLVSLPCPESGKSIEGVSIGRNGFAGAVKLCQQRYWNDLLISVVECACGMRYRLETLADALPAIDALHREAERRRHDARVGPHYRNDDGTDEAAIDYQGHWYDQVAERIAAGYGGPPAEFLRALDDEPARS